MRVLYIRKHSEHTVFLTEMFNAYSLARGIALGRTDGGRADLTVRRRMNFCGLGGRRAWRDNPTSEGWQMVLLLGVLYSSGRRCGGTAVHDAGALLDGPWQKGCVASSGRRSALCRSYLWRRMRCLEIGCPDVAARRPYLQRRFGVGVFYAQAESGAVWWRDLQGFKRSSM
jgi:hypothetical protein